MVAGYFWVAAVFSSINSRFRLFFLLLVLSLWMQTRFLSLLPILSFWLHGGGGFSVRARVCLHLWMSGRELQIRRHGFCNMYFFCQMLWTNQSVCFWASWVLGVENVTIKRACQLFPKCCFLRSSWWREVCVFGCVCVCVCALHSTRASQQETDRWIFPLAHGVRISCCRPNYSASFTFNEEPSQRKR